LPYKTGVRLVRNEPQCLRNSSSSRTDFRLFAHKHDIIWTHGTNSDTTSLFTRHSLCMNQVLSISIMIVGRMRESAYHLNSLNSNYCYKLRHFQYCNNNKKENRFRPYNEPPTRTHVFYPTIKSFCKVSNDILQNFQIGIFGCQVEAVDYT
jgi:hypothetical protein